MTKTKKQLRAEAVERLKNCVAARFDAESIIIALTSGRRGQSDWSLECDKLIYLLTDDSNDDSTPEKVVSGSKPCVTPESCRQYVDQREQGDDADCESCDSREKLEADVYRAADEMDRFYCGEKFIDTRKIIGWLDRQAAITEREYGERMASEAMCSNVCAVVCEQRGHIAELQVEVDELTAERDKLEELNEYNALQYELASEDCDRLQAEVDTLKAERIKLRSQICKLEDDLVRTSDERDNWKANCEDWKKHARAAENACYETMLEREDYRKKFGKCLDYADAIHALMDDEGMA